MKSTADLQQAIIDRLQQYLDVAAEPFPEIDNIAFTHPKANLWILFQGGAPEGNNSRRMTFDVLIGVRELVAALPYIDAVRVILANAAIPGFSALKYEADGMKQVTDTVMFYSVTFTGSIPIPSVREADIPAALAALSAALN